MSRAAPFFKKSSNYSDDVKTVITTYIGLKWACLAAGLEKMRTKIFCFAKKLTHCSKTQRLFPKLFMPLNEKFLLLADYHQANQINKVLASSKICENIN